MTFLYRYRHILAGLVIIALLLAAIVYTSSETPAVQRVRSWVLQVVWPVQDLFHRVVAVGGDSIEFIREVGQYRLENERLREEIERLKTLEVQAEELRQENQRLERLLEFKSRLASDSPFQGQAANVIGRNPDTWFARVQVDKGSRDGVRPGTPVVTASGLVGRVSMTEPFTSTVLLLTDPDSGVGAEVQRQTSRAGGVVRGLGGPEPGLVMQFYDRDADVLVGDRVVTSGYGGIFPRGLPIGLVTEVTTGEFGLVKRAVIQPAVELDRLHEVILLLPDEMDAPPGGAGDGTAGGEARP